MKDIEGYEGSYAVTNQGQIWSYPKTVKVGSNGGFRHDDGKWLSATKAKSGKNHLRVYLAKDGIKTAMLVHRAVASAYIENINSFPFINHIDGDPMNNSVDNLEWCTAKQNAQHATNMGMNMPPVQKGNRNSQAKLTEDQVRAIRRQYEQVKNCSAIARTYGVCPKTVNDIIHNKRWSNLL